MFKIIGSSFNSISFKNVKTLTGQNVLPEDDYSYGVKMDSAYSSEAAGEAGLSLRNAASSKSIMPPISEGTTGDNAEEFEVTEYNASIETRNLEDTCWKIEGMKAKDYVIFENANKYKNGCNYRFKVRKDNRDEVLAIIKEMEPKELAENIYTIKKLVDDYTSEEEILKKKLLSVEETLNAAINSYDEIKKVAEQKQDAETLAKIIDSKIRLIEQLAQERININSQLDRILRAKAEQLDRMEYTVFNVNVFENKFVNGDDLKDSWKLAVKEFVFDINKAVQGITINLIKFIILAVQYIIYIFIIIIAVKYLWKAAKYVWNK
ncbi:MAG: hypothetical protein V1860_00390 [bacterium]